MLFGTTYTFRHASEESNKRTLQLFTNWTPPAGFEFKAHYILADGSGGITIVEAESAQAFYEACATWTPFLDFKASPIIDAIESIPISQRVIAWRESVR